MGRIIINNRSSISDDYATMVVAKIIEEGRTSDNGKQYCYIMSFKQPKVVVVSTLNKGSDSFFVYDDKHPQKEESDGNA